MRRLLTVAAAGLSLLAANNVVRAEDGGEASIEAASTITPWETRDTEFAAPSDEDKRLARSLHYTALIEKYAEQYDVPVELATAVIQIESNFRPTVKGSAGEIGLMQVKPATARLMGYEGPDYGLYDPETNIRFGMKYLAGAQDLGDGRVCSTILKYNAGHGARRMNPTSKRYCSRVQAVLASNESRRSATRIVYRPDEKRIVADASLEF